MAGIQVPPDSTGKIVDTFTLTDAAVEVHRQKMVVTGGSGTAEVVTVGMSAPAASAMGLTVRQAGTVDVALAGKVTLSGTATVVGTVSLGAGTANIGHINHISATVVTSGLAGLTAGAANIGFINHISAAVTTTGLAGLTAGTSNIGHLNHISQTVQVAIGTPFTINNISATAIVAGALNISGSVVISGSVNIFAPGEFVSASRGPRCVLVSASANATLVAAPGAGLCIFVTSLAVSNASGSNTRSRVGTSASIGQVTMMLAASGGGYVMQFTPPWQLSANEALLGSVKPSVSEAIVNIHFFVGSADAF